MFGYIVVEEVLEDCIVLLVGLLGDRMLVTLVPKEHGLGGSTRILSNSWMRGRTCVGIFVYQFGGLMVETCVQCPRVH